MNYWNDLHLWRVKDNSIETIGFYAYFDGTKIHHGNTLELPWKDNKQDVSCIRADRYKVTKYKSPTKGNVLLLHNVKGRGMIEMHIANYVHQLLGCIAVGTSSGDIDGDGQLDNKHSRDAFEELYNAVPNEFYITIHDENLIFTT